MQISSSSGDFEVGDLVEIGPRAGQAAYVVDLDGDKPGSGFYVVTPIIVVWLGVDFVDFGIDRVECDVFLYEGQRHALINGACEKLG